MSCSTCPNGACRNLRSRRSTLRANWRGRDRNKAQQIHTGNIYIESRIGLLSFKSIAKCPDNASSNRRFLTLRLSNCGILWQTSQAGGEICSPKPICPVPLAWFPQDADERAWLLHALRLLHLELLPEALSGLWNWNFPKPTGLPCHPPHCVQSTSSDIPATISWLHWKLSSASLICPSSQAWPPRFAFAWGPESSHAIGPTPWEPFGRTTPCWKHVCAFLGWHGDPKWPKVHKERAMWRAQTYLKSFVIFPFKLLYMNRLFASSTLPMSHGHAACVAKFKL